ncbi:hypothetical protein [Pedobacter jejuensis]|uniref:Uncharacterized protein n=1 Tax=Pedobacter jejuensis TaxID=1268550 RepID=A0A3N0BQD9_9SPHI|nr:hypothetical protein [Pedobacter jejuensis]RNL51186.1 hypothetical protein D7004_15830 [Pedobacter jejuensis]
MESKKIKNKVLKVDQEFISQLQAKDLDHFSFKDCLKKQNEVVSINPKDFTSQKYQKHAQGNKKQLENIENNIIKINENKEDKLLNLIVKIIVKSTLEQLYGKESN